jgi:hypothetical protein
VASGIAGETFVARAARSAAAVATAVANRAVDRRATADVVRSTAAATFGIRTRPARRHGPLVVAVVGCCHLAARSGEAEAEVLVRLGDAGLDLGLDFPVVLDVSISICIRVGVGIRVSISICICISVGIRIAIGVCISISIGIGVAIPACGVVGRLYGIHDVHDVVPRRVIAAPGEQDYRQHRTDGDLHGGLRRGRDSTTEADRCRRPLPIPTVVRLHRLKRDRERRA